MPYPEYIPTRVIRFGGATGQASGTLLCTKVVIKSSKSLVHNSTGYRFEEDTVTGTSTAGGEVEFILPCTDTVGMRDAKLNTIIDVSAENSYTHTYTATITFVTTAGKPANNNSYTVGPFVLPYDAEGTVLDGDKMVNATTVAGQQVNFPDYWTARLDALEADFAELGGVTVGTTAGTVAAGDDSRFETIPDGYVTDAKVNATAAINADKIADGTANKVYSASDKSKLAGIASGATANSSDATLLARANHTGTQTSSTISDLYEVIEDRMSTFLANGTGISLSYNDAGNLLTITNIGTADAEAIQDALGAAMIGIGLISVAYNDAANTITVSTTATANDTDANLKNRANHTGTQAFSTISGTSTLAQAAPGDVFKCPWNSATSKWQYPPGTDITARPSARTDIFFEYVGAPYTYDSSQPTYALDIDTREDV